MNAFIPNPPSPASPAVPDTYDRKSTDLYTGSLCVGESTFTLSANTVYRWGIDFGADLIPASVTNKEQALISVNGADVRVTFAKGLFGAKTPSATVGMTIKDGNSYVLPITMLAVMKVWSAGTPTLYMALIQDPT